MLMVLSSLRGLRHGKVFPRAWTVQGLRTPGRGMWGHPGRTCSMAGQPSPREDGFLTSLDFWLSSKARGAAAWWIVMSKGCLGVAGLIFSPLTQRSAGLDGAALGSLGSVLWVGMRHSLSSKLMMLTPADPVWHRAGCRGCPPPWPGVGRWGLSESPLCPMGPSSGVAPTHALSFCLCCPCDILFCAVNRQGKACRQLLRPTLLLGITTDLPSRHPVGPVAAPDAPWGWGPPGNGSNAVTLCRWCWELPAGGS